LRRLRNPTGTQACASTNCTSPSPLLGKEGERIRPPWKGGQGGYVSVSRRSVRIDLGINGAFLTRRWADADAWMRLTGEIGFRCHEFCADLLDPFFSGDDEYRVETARAVREAADRHGIEITDIYTGVATHRFHGLSHPDPRVRDRMREWILGCMDIAAAMGVSRIGGHWDAVPVEALDGGPRYEKAFQAICGEFRRLSVDARERGLSAISNEQMYIPGEIPWTLDQAERFLIDVNRDREGVPVRLTIDVGHQAGMHYGLGGDDLSYVCWLERLGAFSEIVHLQQTTPDASAHWPFTDACNQLGHVRVESVLAAVERSHQRAHGSPVAQVLDPVSRTILALEMIPGSTKTEDAVLGELKESYAYLSQYIPADGLVLIIP
jgi:sugar phosphate isomerase/epimerase